MECLAEPEEQDPSNISLSAADLGVFAPPIQLDKSDILDPTSAPHPIIAPNGPVTYIEIADGLSCGNSILVDNVGYRYSKEVDKSRSSITWRCYQRRTCNVTMLEHHGGYRCWNLCCEYCCEELLIIYHALNLINHIKIT